MLIRTARILRAVRKSMIMSATESRGPSDAEGARVIHPHATCGRPAPDLFGRLLTFGALALQAPSRSPSPFAPRGPAVSALNGKFSTEGGALATAFAAFWAAARRICSGASRGSA